MRVAAISTLVITVSTSAACAAASTREEKEIRTTVYEYAKCVVRAHHVAAYKAIIADENNNAIARQYGELIDSDCLGRVAGNVKVTFGGDLYRYALADALVNQDFASGGPTDFSDRLPLAHILPPDETMLNAKIAGIKNSKQRSEIRRIFEGNVAAASLSRYGECVVRQDPVNARLWILTPPERPEETSRINALSPAFSSCMDGNMTFDRATMRGTIALNYYRLAMATPTPAARKLN